MEARCYRPHRTSCDSRKGACSIEALDLAACCSHILHSACFTGAPGHATRRPRHLQGAFSIKAPILVARRLHLLQEECFARASGPMACLLYPLKVEVFDRALGPYSMLPTPSAGDRFTRGTGFATRRLRLLQEDLLPGTDMAGALTNLYPSCGEHSGRGIQLRLRPSLAE